MAANNNQCSTEHGPPGVDMASDLQLHMLFYASRSEYAVAHSNVENVSSTRDVSEMPLKNMTLKIRHFVQIDRLTNLQGYAWSHLSNGADHGAYIVAPVLSGRTIAYMLPLCETVRKVASEQGAGDTVATGPVAVIVAADARRAREIAKLSKLMLKDEPVATVTLEDSESTLEQLYNSMSCLIVTLAQIVRLKKISGAIQYAELRYVVFDDVDLMEPYVVSKAFEYLLEIVQQTMRPMAQLVLTSKSYDAAALQKLRDFNKYPLLLFGDALEASYYGGVPIQMHLLKPSEKLEFVLHALRTLPPQKLRTLIYCKSDFEIDQLIKDLTFVGYRCIAYYQTSNDITMRERLTSWISKTEGKILVTTDRFELNIRNIQSLIHYSMANTWIKFGMRYVTFTDYIPNILLPTPVEEENLHSVVLLDAANTLHWAHLTAYLKSHPNKQPEKEILLEPSAPEDVAEQSSHELALCPQLMSMGECRNLIECKNRHELVEYDCDLPDRVPFTGHIKFDLIKVYSPVHFCVRLSEHKPENGEWINILDPAYAYVNNIRLQLFMNEPLNRHPYWPPKVREVCICHVNSKVFERVRILSVPHMPCMETVCPELRIEVQAMDTDRRTFTTTAGTLYEGPQAFLAHAAQVIDMRLVGLLPRTVGHNWQKEHTELCRDWLGSLPKSSFLQAKLLFSMSHTLFVEEFVACSTETQMPLFNLGLQLAEWAGIYCNSIKAAVLNVFGNLILYQRADDSPISAAAQLKLSDSPKQYLDMPTTPIEQTTSSQATDDVQERATSDVSFKHIYDWLKNGYQQLGYPDVQTALDAFFYEEPKPQAGAVATHQGANAAPESACLTFAHPEIIYYQTNETLELQVKLPSDNVEYKLVVGRNVVFFITRNLDPQYGFCINMENMYKSYKERLQDCSLYISICKTLAQPYPMCFTKYNFMKLRDENAGNPMPQLAAKPTEEHVKADDSSEAKPDAAVERPASED